MNVPVEHTNQSPNDIGTRHGYAPVNGLAMYFEIHGQGRPLLLLHGAFSTIGTSFGALLPKLAQHHQVIAVELQGHGRTADIERPLTYEQMADDTAALLEHLGIAKADVFGYSMGAGVALQLTIRQPRLVRKLVVASVTYRSDGLYPEVLAGLETTTPESLLGSPWHEEYLRTAPDPQSFPALVSKLIALDRTPQAWSPEAIRGIAASTLVIVGDSDIVRPEHALEMFRLFGGGVAGDLVGLPKAQLAVLPGTTHATLVDRTDWLLTMVTPFLETSETVILTTA